MAESIRIQKIHNETFNGKFIVSIFILQSQDLDRNNNTLTHIVNLFRRNYERNFMYHIADFCRINKDLKFKQSFPLYEECPEPYYYQCDCDKFHLRDICSIEVQRKADLRSLIEREYTITWTERCLSEINISILLALMANRLCIIDFYDTFNVGTHLLFNFEFGKNRYETEFKHHSEQSYEHLLQSLTFMDNVNLKEKVKITVFVVKTLDFANNEAAKESLNRLRTRILQTKKENETTTSVPLFGLQQVPQNSWKENPNPDEVESLLMNSILFKNGSKLNEMASTTPIPVRSIYTVLSSHTKLCTSKSKIIILNISLEYQYLEEVINKNMLISNVIMDIININGIGYPIRKERRTTVKLMMGGNTIEAVFNCRKQWNINVINEQLFTEITINIEKQFHLEVHYRMLK